MVKNKNNCERYIWGRNCEGWHLVKTSTLGVIQEVMPSGTEEMRHKHNQAQQFFYILKGEAVFEVDSEQIVVKQGEGIHVLAGQAHQILNRSEEAIEFLVISEPHSHGDRELL